MTKEGCYKFAPYEIQNKLQPKEMFNRQPAQSRNFVYLRIHSIVIASFKFHHYMVARDLLSPQWLAAQI